MKLYSCDGSYKQKQPKKMKKQLVVADEDEDGVVGGI